MVLFLNTYGAEVHRVAPAPNPAEGLRCRGWRRTIRLLGRRSDALPIGDITAGGVLGARDLRARRRHHLIKRLLAGNARVRAHLLVDLGGVRRTLERWSPRPALLDDAERAAFRRVLEDLLDERAADVLNEFAVIASVAAGKSLKALHASNRERPTTQDKPSAAARAAMRETTVDNEHMERVTHADGSFHFAYSVRPDKQKGCKCARSSNWARCRADLPRRPNDPLR
jgi:hypothetical protein